ncbi:MAG TPA: LysR family transcriptional regulator [Gemmatimonadaceae bacterium]
MGFAPSLDLLASFAALAEDLHYTRAANRLHVAQPALTKRIQQLEDAVGTPLFIRSRRAVRLSPAGELLLPRVRHVLDAVEDFSHVARRVADGEVGRLRVGFSPSAPHLLLPAIMRAFRRRHPGVECVLTELPSEIQISQIASGDLDAGILRPPATVPAAIRCTTIFEEPFVAVLPRDHRLASRRTVPLAALAPDPFIVIARRTAAAVHDQVLGACATAGFSPRMREATHVHAVVSLVAAGSGVSVLPRSAAQLGVKDVVCRPLARSTLVTVMAVAQLADGAPPAVASLVDAATKIRPSS